MSLTFLNEQAVFPGPSYLKLIVLVIQGFLFQHKPCRHCPNLHFYNGGVPGVRPELSYILPTVELPLAAPLRALCAGSGHQSGKPHSLPAVNTQNLAKRITLPFNGCERQHTTEQQILEICSPSRAAIQERDTDARGKPQTHD